MTLILGSTLKWEICCPNNNLSVIISSVISSVMDGHDGDEC